MTDGVPLDASYSKGSFFLSEPLGLGRVIAEDENSNNGYSKGNHTFDDEPR